MAEDITLTGYVYPRDTLEVRVNAYGGIKVRAGDGDTSVCVIIDLDAKQSLELAEFITANVTPKTQIGLLEALGELDEGNSVFVEYGGESFTISPEYDFDDLWMDNNLTYPYQLLKATFYKDNK